ncbi:MAG: universal stress protein [Myxococcota bacterium]
MKRFYRIIACTDFSDLGNRAVEMAFAFAHGGKAKIWLIHVVDPPPMPNPMYAHYIGHSPWEPGQLEKATTEVAKALGGLIPPGAKKAGVEVAFEAPQGAPAVEILRLAEVNDAEVIVIGTRGRTGIEHLLLGSVAERVVRQATCAVMVVHQ